MAELMTEDNTAEKVAFVNRKDTNEDKLNREEEEQKQLLAQQKRDQGTQKKKPKEQQTEKATARTLQKHLGN